MKSYINTSISPNQAIFFIVVLTLSIIGYFYTLFDEIAMLERVNEQSVLLKIRTAVIPLIVMMPALCILIWGIFCRLKNRVLAQKQKMGLFVIIACFPMFLIVWLIYSWQLTSWLHDKGYTECSWYSGASLGAPKIMMNNVGLCLDEGYQVRVELLDWFEEQYKQGVTPTIDTVIIKQQQLLLDYNDRFNLL
ncbi:hypothetical protein [Colwellia sp. 20A7]|uniref:hypothetical protein n=1 Tax=Colwellia sp. 20A7 TaxID=2689569 RepID=UPI00135B305F|nr:hypothetical protein [Colwellia sp. 20A7]